MADRDTPAPEREWLCPECDWLGSPAEAPAQCPNCSWDELMPTEENVDG